jgi:type IV pilus assembly protein PilB
MEQRKHLGEYFVSAGLMNQEQVQRALELQKQKGGFLGQIFVEEGWVTEQQLCQVLSKMLRVHWTNIDFLLIGQDIIQLVPRSLAITCKVLPICAHNNTLLLAMENPSDSSIIEFLETKTRMRVKPLLVPIQQLQMMLRKYYYDSQKGGKHE